MLLLAIAIYMVQTSLCFTSPIINWLSQPLPGTAVHTLVDSQILCFVDLDQWLVVEFNCTVPVEVEHQHLISTNLEKLLSAEV